MLLENLQRQTKVSYNQLDWIARTASERYKCYRIPKRTSGYRVILHPSKQLKAVQRWIVGFLLSELPVHKCATAYKKGCDIGKNARKHRKSNYTVRVDFKNFFPSFSNKGVLDYLSMINQKMDLGLNNKDIKFVASIVSRNEQLTIGAPSSPILTNAMMYEFDKKLYKYSRDREITYTRYADDLFFSSKEKENLDGIEKKVRSLCKGFQYANLEINTDKTAYLSKKYRRVVTGLVITPQHEVSVGRKRKREIKSLVFAYLNNTLEKEKLSYLQGWIAYVGSVEPTFLDSLQKKYGMDVISKLRSNTG